jgi:hypothetical protein
LKLQALKLHAFKLHAGMLQPNKPLGDSAATDSNEND